MATGFWGCLMKNTVTLAFVSLIQFCIPAAYSDTFGSDANSFDIEFVTIGNPGNPADTTGNPNPAGSVPHSYRIGKFEISRGMVTKANNAGGLEITLADNSRNTGNGENRAATGVSWNEAARFVNWLNTSTGSPPAYKFAVQPGQIGYDANDNIELWTISDAGYNPNNLYRNSLARYFLPSVDEWYKSAYYDPNANGGAGGYWNYPTGSDSAPTPVTSGTAAGTAVATGFTPGLVYVSPRGPADIMQAGGLSPYGTMGQGGNVLEWEETDFDLVNGPTLSSSTRGMGRAKWNWPNSWMRSALRSIDSPDIGFDHGFRVASTPEPGTLLLGAIAGIGLLFPRRRRNG